MSEVSYGDLAAAEHGKRLFHQLRILLHKTFAFGQ
jgi:hypothetical protein